jgi:hypothetical protein
MSRLRACWIWLFAGAALVGIGLVGQAGAVPTGRVLGVPLVTNLQCPSTSLCVGTVGDGVSVPGANLFVSRAPRSSKWERQSIDGGRRLRVLTCLSARWCLAVDQQNRVLISTDPARGAASWRLAPGGPGRHLDNVQQLSCPSVHLCVGVAGHYVVSSRDGDAVAPDPVCSRSEQLPQPTSSHRRSAHPVPVRRQRPLPARA